MIKKTIQWTSILILFLSWSSITLSQISVSGLTNINWVEGSSQPIQFGSNAIVSGGVTYGGGYLLFDLEEGDQLGFISSSTPNASGAISYSGSNVYLGNGTSTNVIGNIDPTLNGQNGNDLKINFTGEFSNSSFENGISGWTIGQQMVDLGVTKIAGYTTPNDNTNPAYSGGDGDVPGSANYNYETVTSQQTHGTSSLRLYSTMTTKNGYDVVHGPYVYSDPFQSLANDVISFDWRAYAGSDAYDVFGYILKITI